MTVALWIFAPIGFVVSVWVLVRLPFWIRAIHREDTQRAFDMAALGYRMVDENGNEQPVALGSFWSVKYQSGSSAANHVEPVQVASSAPTEIPDAAREPLPDPEP